MVALRYLIPTGNDTESGLNNMTISCVSVELIEYKLLYYLALDLTIQLDE